MGTYQATNPPMNLRMSDILAASNAAGHYAKSCRFVAVIQPAGSAIANLIPRDLMYMCEAVEFPGRGFDVTQVRYYGPSQAFPNNTIYGSGINMQFICRNASPERAFFDDWMDIINPVNNFNFEYADNYYSTIQIYQLADFGKGGNEGVTSRNYQPIATYGWTLNKAWPTLVNPQQVTWADNDILRLQVTFAYKYWDRPDYRK